MRMGTRTRDRKGKRIGELRMYGEVDERGGSVRRM